MHEVNQKKVVSWNKFLISTSVTLLAIITGNIMTYVQLSATRDQNRKANASVVLKDVNDAISNTCEQLESQASMYMEMENCIHGERNSLQKCWSRKYEFQPLASQRAWTNLDSIISSAIPLMEGENKRKILEELLNIGVDHTKRLHPLLGPRTPEDTKRLVDEILDTRNLLINSQKRLRKAIINKG